MPAPAVYVLAVVGTIGAAFAFKHFVYEPHLAPKIEQWAEEYIARRRARRMQRQGPIPVPASIPLRRRRGNRSKHSDSTLSGSDSGDDSNDDGPSNRHSDLRQASSSRRSARGSEFDPAFAREVGEWRSEVERSQTVSGLRHRTNINAHVMDQSINLISHPTMSPTHVIIDTSAPATPTTVTLPSRDPSPPPQVSPIQSANSDSTLRPSTASPQNAPPRPPRLSRVRTPPSASPPRPTIITPTLANPAGAGATDTAPAHPSPSFPSPIPSLSQSYPQELDREHGVELLSPPSSGTSSPFSTFSPFVAPQALSPFTVVQPLDHNSPAEIHSRSPNPAFRALSSSQHTTTSTTHSSYQSLPTSPVIATSNLSSPINVTHEQTRSPSPHEELSYLSSPSPVNFTSPNALSPRSPHSDLSDLDFESDVDVLSDQGSEGSDRSWAGVSSASGSSANRR